jgi:hypothetical protein
MWKKASITPADKRADKARSQLENAPARASLPPVE